MIDWMSNNIAVIDIEADSRQVIHQNLKLSVVASEPTRAIARYGSGAMRKPQIQIAIYRADVAREPRTKLFNCHSLPIFRASNKHQVCVCGDIGELMTILHNEGTFKT